MIKTDKPERLLKTHSTSSKSVMVSMDVSKLGPMDLICINVRLKINGAYYREVLLTQKLLSVMREICGEFFQQGNVPAHRARQTINFLERNTCVHFTRPFATQQHRTEPRCLQDTGKMQKRSSKFMTSMN